MFAFEIQTGEDRGAEFLKCKKKKKFLVKNADLSFPNVVQKPSL